MKTIRTRFIPATNTRGARITAEDSNGQRVTISYPHELDTEAAHRSAVTDWVFKYSQLAGVIRLTPAWFKHECYWTVSN